jgi:hypothetical protein
LRTHVEAYPSNLSHGRNQRKTLQIARTKIGSKIPLKIKKKKNISAHTERWFNPKPWMYWCKSRVYKVWKPLKHPSSLWKIGEISHFSPLFSKTWSTPHLSKWRPKSWGWERDSSHNRHMVLFIPKIKRLECPYGLKGKLQLMKDCLVLTSTMPHPTPSNWPSFALLPCDLRDDATCTTRHRSSASFDAKLENPSPTCFTMKQAARCRCVSTHRLQPLIDFEVQTDKPPPT